jgi:hypothetical protein
MILFLVSINVLLTRLPPASTLSKLSPDSSASSASSSCQKSNEEVLSSIQFTSLQFNWLGTYSLV